METQTNKVHSPYVYKAPNLDRQFFWDKPDTHTRQNVLRLSSYSRVPGHCVEPLAECWWDM